MQCLTLEQIQADLKKNMIVSDSVEMGIRTTISSPLISNVQHFFSCSRINLFSASKAKRPRSFERGPFLMP